MSETNRPGGFVPGDRVRIPAGTRVHSMRTGDWRELSRAQTVKVDHLIRGDEPMVSWAGSGGYWQRAYITAEMAVVA